MLPFVIINLIVKHINNPTVNVVKTEQIKNAIIRGMLIKIRLVLLELSIIAMEKNTVQIIKLTVNEYLKEELNRDFPFTKSL